MTKQDICALVALAASSNPTMQSKDPAPIVAAWSLMLADLDPVVAKAAVIKVCRESDYFPSVARIIAAADVDPKRLVAKNLFADNLYILIAQSVLRTPSLRHRQADIPQRRCLDFEIGIQSAASGVIQGDGRLVAGTGHIPDVVTGIGC